MRCSICKAEIGDNGIEHYEIYHKKEEDDEP